MNLIQSYLLMSFVPTKLYTDVITMFVFI